MKKIALISYNHPESTLPLCKYLINEDCSVDYFFITGISYQGTAAFEFGYKTKYPCLKKLTNHNIKSMYKYFDSENIKIYLLVLPPSLERYGKKFSNIFSIFKITFLFLFSLFIKFRKYDAINIVGQKTDLVYLQKFLKGIKKIHSLHEVLDYYTRKPNHKDVLMNYLINNKIPIIVHSLNSYNDLLKYYSVNPKDIHFIPFGLFETYKIFDNENKIKNTKIGKDFILFFGMIEPYKGLSVLYEAMELVLKEMPTIKIVVAGRGSDPSIEKMLHNSSYTVLNRFITNEEIIFLNKNAKFIVCPYLTASQSGIVQTTFLFDKPIIASDVGAFREIIIPNENGLLVEPNNPESLAKSIKLLFNNDEYYNKLQKGVSSFIEKNEKFNWQIIARQYKAIFEQL